jgi:hypothetical protein
MTILGAASFALPVEPEPRQDLVHSATCSGAAVVYAFSSVSCLLRWHPGQTAIRVAGADELADLMAHTGARVILDAACPESVMVLDALEVVARRRPAAALHPLAVAVEHLHPIPLAEGLERELF